MRIVEKIKIKINGGVFLITSRYGLLNMSCAVKMSHPNGGVALPIAACNTISVPKNTGSIPVITTYGWKIGEST